MSKRVKALIHHNFPFRSQVEMAFMRMRRIKVRNEGLKRDGRKEEIREKRECQE
jgi:hypothetical protein